MTLSRSNPRAKRRWLLLGATVATLMLTVVALVLAVHDENFQLDGDVIASTTTSKGTTGTPPVAKTQTLDWDSLFTATGANKSPLPTGFKSAGFELDFVTSGSGAFVTSDTTTFATGSKDTLPISGWQCNFDNNVNSKIDIMNAYAGKYVDPTSLDEIMYFALERNTNTGDANVGFWFLQQKVGCETTGASTTFTGNHQDGDVLVVSQFSGGGDVSTINAYRWDGGADGSLRTTPIATGVDCRGETFGTNDPICGVANTATITTPWPTANFKDKVGTTLRVAEFFEGGINLTDTQLGGRCFNTFIGDTRSSTSLTATLFDFAAGVIGECTSTTVTTPSIVGTPPAIGSQAIPGDPADASVSVTDSATVTVTGVNTWSGTVSWNLCGPTAVTSAALCTTGGVAVGATKPATNAAPTVVSDAAIVTSAGRYCWRADFSGDTAAGVPASSDSRATECFVITPLQPTLTTQAGAGPVDLGSAVTDTATLGNTAHQPGTGGPTGSNGTINPTTLGGDADGTITFTLYKADCTTLATGTGTNPQTATVSGNDTYGPVSFTPDAPGTYHWVASYDGDLPNTLSATHNTLCNQTAESVVVRQIPTQIATTPSMFPQDSATVTSSLTGNNLPADGTVIFRLYGATVGGNTALQNCRAHGATVGSGGLLYSETKLTGVAAHSATVGTNNTNVRVSTDGTYFWRVTYAPGGTVHTGSQSDCVENIVADFTGDAGPGTLFP